VTDSSNYNQSARNEIGDLNYVSSNESRSGLEPLLKKRDWFNGSSAQCIAEQFPLSFTSTRRSEWGGTPCMDERAARSEPGKIRTAIPNRL
jgi:hypothetical protein